MSADYWRRWPAPLTFTDVGDEVDGVIVSLGDLKERWPELHIRQADGLIRVVRVTQARLHEQLAERKPGVGDRIKITYTGEAAKAVPGMSPAKEFTVKVGRAGTPASPRADVASGDGTSAPKNAAEAGG